MSFYRLISHIFLFVDDESYKKSYISNQICCFFSRAISKNKEGVVFLENQERAETGRGRVLPIGT